MTERADFYRRIEAECPAFQTRVAARALTRYYNACFGSVGITAEQFSLLMGIEGSDQPTLAELAVRAGVDATTLSRSVRNLERDNLVRSQGGRGRVGKRLKLTENGLSLMEKAIVAWENARAGLAEAMGADESSKVRGVMSSLTTAAQAATRASGSSKHTRALNKKPVSSGSSSPQATEER